MVERSKVSPVPWTASRASPALFGVLSLLAHASLVASLWRTESPAIGRGSGTLTGETLEIEPTAPLVREDLAISEAAIATPTPTATATPTPTAKSAGGLRSSSAASTVSANPAAPLFGAVGARTATDLVTTFIRAFPQAASADAIWSTVPFGSAGRAQLTIELNEEGRVVRTEIGGSPSAALRIGIQRTLVLLGAREFTARGAVTRLSVTAYVSRDDTHDGLHGDVFALSAGSFSGDVGTAFFALPTSSGRGRRVDVELRLLH